MPPVDLYKIFGLESKQTYWKLPFNPKDCYMTEIRAENLPDILDTQKVTARFLRLLEAYNVKTPLLAYPTISENKSTNNSGILYAFEAYVPMTLTRILEKAINAELRNHGRIPDYTISVSTDETYKYAMNTRYDGGGPSQEPEPN
jgi:hypothetical protein